MMSLVQLTFPERDLKLQISPSTLPWRGAQFGAGLQHAHQPPNERSCVPKLQLCFEAARFNQVWKNLFEQHEMNEMNH